MLRETVPALFENMLQQAREPLTRTIAYDHRDPLLLVIAEAFAEAGNLEQARKTAGEMWSTYHQDQVLVAIAKALAERGDFKQGRQTADRIRDSYVDAYWRTLAFVAIGSFSRDPRHLEWARRAAIIVSYWENQYHAEAWAAIAGLSKDPQDLKEVRKTAKEIRLGTQTEV